MTQAQYFKNLTVPNEKIDVVLDTDAYNEIDDQFAISYLLCKEQELNVKGLCAAPFWNARSSSPADGMKKSYDEICKLLEFMNKSSLKTIVRKGSETYLPNESTPVESDAAQFMAELSDRYSPEHPLYIVAIGAITNVASALLKNPRMKENCVIVWLGGHALHQPLAASEFNMMQDIAAARVIFSCGVPLVQLPCCGIVDHFSTTRYELEYWLKGKNALCNYLCESTIREAESYAAGRPWSRVIWDVTAVAWLLNRDCRFMRDRLIPSPIPEYDMHYAHDSTRHFVNYVYEVYRDAIFEDLFQTLGAQA